MICVLSGLFLYISSNFYHPPNVFAFVLYLYDECTMVCYIWLALGYIIKSVRKNMCGCKLIIHINRVFIRFNVYLLLTIGVYTIRAKLFDRFQLICIGFDKCSIVYNQVII